MTRATAAALAFAACSGPVGFVGTDPPVDEVLSTLPSAPVEVTLDTTDAPVVDTDATPGDPTGAARAVPDPADWPHGLAYDPLTSRLLVSTLTTGRVLAFEPDGTVTLLHDGGPAWEVWGLDADPGRRRLYACAHYVGGGIASWHLWHFDLDTGARLAEADLSDIRADAACRDVAVAPDGHVWMTDREGAQLYRYTPLTTTLQPGAVVAPLASDTRGGHGLDITPDGRFALVARSIPAGIVRVDLRDPSYNGEVRLDGDLGLAGGRGLQGASWWQGALWVAAQGVWLEITPNDADWQSATVLRHDTAVEDLSDVVPAGGTLWGLSGDPFAWDLGVAADLPFELGPLR